ncbi:helix-turn-helix domain-containing protein [Hungatella sp.]|uniref:helix-turn-helix domain-containing protein n=1 Tax=Hungatella sp. TaxID=2613924 RepID=UPI003993A0D7
MGLTQEELAEKIGRAYKYCQDIERGTCGMSIDTMLSIASCLNISLDYLIYGNNEDTSEFTDLDVEQQAVIEILGNCSIKKKKICIGSVKNIYEGL